MHHNLNPPSNEKGEGAKQPCLNYLNGYHGMITKVLIIIHVNLTRVSYIVTFLILRFIQDFGLFRAQFRQISLYLERTILLSPQKKTMTYGVVNPGPDLGQAQKCGGVKFVNRIPTPPPPIIIRSSTIQNLFYKH